MKKGFTLVEVLVSVAIFSIIISVITGIFVYIVRTQRNTFAKQELLNQTSYVLEYMSRALRMAKKDTNAICISAGLNYENPGGDVSRVKFINETENDACQEFLFDEGDKQIKEIKNGGLSVPITSEKLQINQLKFKLSGESENDTFQPRVTIFLEVQVKGAGNQPKMQIQTSISQRNIDEKTF